MKLEIFEKTALPKDGDNEGLSALLDTHKKTTDYCVKFLNNLLKEKKYITKSALKNICHLGQKEFTDILSIPEGKLDSLERKIIAPETKERLAMGIMMLIPDLNMHLARKRLVGKKPLPIKPTACIESADTLAELRLGYAKAFGSFGYVLMEEEHLDEANLTRRLKAYLDLFKKKR